MDPYAMYSIPSHLRADIITIDEILAGNEPSIYGSLDADTRATFARNRLVDLTRDLDNLFAVMKQQLS